MSNTSIQRRFLREVLFPFRGTWHLPWVIQRYYRGAVSGFTVPRVLNASLALAENRLGISRVHSMPFVLRIEPTNTCNLRCPLCACGMGRDPRPKGFMSMDDYQRVLRENTRYGMIVRLDGMGEPTLHPQVFDMIRAAKAQGSSVCMHSNFSSKACEQPERFLEAGLDRLVVDVDGASEDTHQRYRVGGSLGVIAERLKRLSEARKRAGRKRPILEVQMIDFPFNRHERPVMRQLVREWGCDTLTITEADWSVKHAQVDPRKPRRCIWLWSTLTVGWNLDYRACGNAWTLPWPRLSMRDLPVREFWNHPYMRDARTFNVNKSADSIANDTGCKCNRCYEMMVVPLQGDYWCE